MTKKAGREFEELIARIERILAPEGATIKSPDYIPDLITNSIREVDISNRFQDGNETRFITVECRDRVGQQDTTWIEQLVTKQKDIGAWRTYAVSSGRFSKPAIEKANHYGIEIRQFDQITDVEIAQQCASKSSNLRFSILKPDIYFTVKIMDKSGIEISSDELSKEYLEKLMNDVSLIDPSEYFSNSDLVEFNNWLCDPKTDNYFFHFSLSFNLENENHQVDFTSSGKIVSQIILDYKCKKQVLNFPIQSVQQYSSPKRTITQFIESEATNDTHSFKFKLRGRFNPIPVNEKQTKRVRKDN